MSGKSHHMQLTRRRHLDDIRKWITEAGGHDKVNTNQLVRKCMLVFGCTRRKAIEYIEVVTGE